MGSISGDIRALSRSELYSMINELKREIKRRDDENNGSNDGIVCHIKHETIDGSDAEDNEEKYRVKQEVNGIKIETKLEIKYESEYFRSTDQVLSQTQETQDNREKTSAEEVVDSEDNESNDGIDCHINNESNDGQLNPTIDITRKPNGKRKYTSMYSEVNDSEAEDYGSDMSDDSGDEWMCKKRLRKAPNGKYLCDYRGCGLQFSYSWGLRAHSYNHLNAKTKKSLEFEVRSDGRFQCLMTGCYAIHKSIGDLRAHQMSHLNDSFEDYCRLNDNEMDDNSNDELIAGKPLRKGSNGKYRCDYRGCGLEFSFSWGLRVHCFNHLNAKTKNLMPVMYKSNGSHPCLMGDCHTIHDNIGDLRAHQTSHLSSPFEDNCGSDLSDNEMNDSVGDEWMAWKPLPKGSDGEYVCDYKNCGMTFTDESILPKHAFSHLDAKTKKSLTHKKRPDGRLVCLMDACDVLYKDLADLRAHQMSHLRDRFKYPKPVLPPVEDIIAKTRTYFQHMMTSLDGLKCPPIDSTNEIPEESNGESIDSQRVSELKTKTNGKRKRKSPES